MSGDYYNRGFVARSTSSGVVTWLQPLSQTQGSAEPSEIAGCKLTPDGSKLMVVGYSKEPTIAFGGLTKTRRGDEDGIFATLAPTNGTVLDMVTLGKSGETGDGLQRLAKGKTGKEMYALMQTANGATYSDSGSVTCVTSGTRCCVVIKFSDVSTRSWTQTVDDGYCYDGAIAVSPDGTNVFAGTQDNGIFYMLGASNGNFLANKTISGITDYRGIVADGSDIYVTGEAAGTTSADSISISSPLASSSASYAALLKLTIGGGNSLTAASGTWIGTDEYAAGPQFLIPVRNSSGSVKNLVMGVELGGTTLLSGNGYSEQYGSTPSSSSFQYSVG